MSSRTTALAIALLLFGLFAGCGDASPARDLEDASPVRLMDRLSEKDVLAGGFPSGGALEPVYETSFAKRVWAGGDLDQGAMRLTVDGERGQRVATKRVRAAGNSVYLLTGRVRTEDLAVAGEVGATLEIFELDEDGEIRARHRYLERLRGTRPWTFLRARIETDASTRKLQLRAVTGEGSESGAAWFDDVTLKRETKTARLSRLPRYRAHARSAGALEGPERMARRVTLDGDSRPALVTSVGTRLRFDHRVAGEARLRFAVAPGPHTDREVCFPVWQEEELLAMPCSREAEWRSVSLEVDGPAPVVLGTRSASPGAVGLWANPRVERLGRGAAPSIVVIAVDTLRADAVAPYSEAQVRTPRIEAFARSGIVFEHAYSSSSWTAPGFGSLATSLWTTQHGAGTRVPMARRPKSLGMSQRQKNSLAYLPLRDDVLTYAEVLHAAGYETVGFYANFFFSHALGFDRGYDRYQGYSGNNFAGGVEALAAVERWLDDREGNAGPFALMIHMIDPHMRYHWRREVRDEDWPPPEDLSGVERREDAARIVDLNRRNKRRPDVVKKFYEAEVRWVDEKVGELLELFEPHDPWIVLMADHGEAFGEHGRFIHGNALDEELVRVPLILRRPEGRGGGVRVAEPVTILDIAPTLVRAAGLEPPKAWRGRSLLGPREPRDIYLEGVYSGPDRVGMIRWPHKLIWTPAEKVVGQAGAHPFPGSLRLYHLERDPREREDISKESSKRLRELRGELEGFLARSLRGTHVRCRPGDAAAQLSLRLSEPVGQVLAMTTERADAISLSDDRRVADIRIAPGGDRDWIVLRAQSNARIVSHTGPLEGGDAPPERLAAGRCAAWSRGGGAENLGADELGGGALERLKALGYVE